MVTGENNNKFYRMINQGTQFTVEYGRVGRNPTKETYPISKWKTKYNEKIKKGYVDVTNYNETTTIGKLITEHTPVAEFYDLLSRYTANIMSRSYSIKVNQVTPQMVADAQGIINELVDNPSNELLLKLFTILPRQMSNVKHYLFDSGTKKVDNRVSHIIQREQDLLDSVSSNVASQMAEDQTLKDLLGVDLRPVEITAEIKSLIDSTNSSYYKIHKVFEVIDTPRKPLFEGWVGNHPNQHTELLIHGTRNPNVFNILKTGLILRPTNVVISGAAYGHGIYHSAHTDKSIGYTGMENDAVFFLQRVHMGKPFTYDGWYRDGKSISKSQMSYEGLKKLGYDSLYVKPGDGLRNSEYIVYKEEQTYSQYVVWLKK